MYEPFFGLRERPFELTPDARFLFLAASHEEALNILQFALRARKGVTLLIGDAGMGKTTLVRAVLKSFRANDAKCVYLNNPTLTRSEFVRFLAHGFGLSPAAATDKIVCLTELERLLRARAEAGAVSALMVDEAQSLPYELLEEVRLLANMETDTTKLLPLILAGQPELATRLNEQALRQLKQRVALRCELRPFDLRCTAGYIATRLRAAGGTAEHTFTLEAVCRIHEASKGIPRIISVLCDNALMAGFAAGVRPVGSALVEEVCRDFDVHGSPTTSGTPVGDDRTSTLATPPIVLRPPAPHEGRGVAPQAEPALVGQTLKRRGLFFWT